MKKINPYNIVHQVRVSTLLFVLIILFSISNSFGQKKVQVTAKGSYEARDLTLEEVRKKAIDEAKHNALVKAGIAENVKVSDFLYTFEDDEKFKDIFQSFISTETGADIIVESVRELLRDINEFGNIMIQVEIDAVVIKHKEKRDPTFDFRVDGIRETYYENDPLDFSFLPSRDGYLKIFNIAETSATILYPYIDPDNPYLDDNPERIFQKKKLINFPVNDRIDGYYFEIAEKNISKEYNLLIFVFTKEDYPFLQEVNLPNIMNWIFEIPLDQRSVQQWGIVLRR